MRSRSAANLRDAVGKYVRVVKNHSAHSDHFDYSADLGPGPGSPPAGNPKWGEGGRFWLAGKRAALDSPGEWFIDHEKHQLFLWAPDSKPPGARVSVRVKDYCVDVIGRPGAPFKLQNLSMHGCTFRLRQCDGCLVSGVTALYPSYDPTIKIRNTPMGPPPNTTLLEGNGSRVVDLHLQCEYSNGLSPRLASDADRCWPSDINNAGLKIVGDDNHVENILIEDQNWLGTLGKRRAALSVQLCRSLKEAAGSRLSGAGDRV